MPDFQRLYDLWDEFLRVWPRERLATMTLDEYTLAGSKDVLTYWLETRLSELGNIAGGGSAFKFGVFSRANTEHRESDTRHAYSDRHAWYPSLGTSAQAAFEKIRAAIVEVAEHAAAGDLAGIERMTALGESYKWKIAFHYQDRAAAPIVNVFARAPLRAFVGTAAERVDDMATLQKLTTGTRPAGTGILEFGEHVWAEWSRKKLVIWKLSHGPQEFSGEERRDRLAQRLAEIYSETGMGQATRFCEAPIGTLFYLCHGNSPQLIGQFTTDVATSPGDGQWRQRSYRTLRTAVQSTPYSVSAKKWSPRGNSTFWQVPTDDLPEFERTLLQPYFNCTLADLAALASEPVEREEPPLPAVAAAAKHVPAPDRSAAFNRIYYGPPGTGKTYTVLKLLRDKYETAAAAATDDDRRRQIIDAEIAPLTWWEGVAAALYDLGERGNVTQLMQHPFIEAISQTKQRTTSIRPTLWDSLQSHTIKDSKTVRAESRIEPLVFDKGASSVWHLAGDWRERCADIIDIVDRIRASAAAAEPIRRYAFATFHQSYGYEEFVEGLRPVLGGETGGEVRYEIREGAFKALCRRARQSPEHRFAMVIDEINRANVSKVFGELITLIEADKRAPTDGSRPPVEVQLACSGEAFSVPANVDVIGTMNTADRSLALVDTALRRRFEFVACMPDTSDKSGAPLAGLVVTLVDGIIDVRRMLARINERIEALYDRDHTIGHAYFTPLRNTQDGLPRFDLLTSIFRERVMPLLEEYFFDDWHKIHLVLADNRKSPAERFVEQQAEQDDEFAELFGTDSDFGGRVKLRYALQDVAFDSPNAYIGIYADPRPDA